MAELSSPYDGAVIDVSDDLVDRYTAAGWVKGESDKPTRRRRATESDESTQK